MFPGETDPCQMDHQELQAFSCLLTLVEALAALPAQGEDTPLDEACSASLMTTAGKSLAEITRQVLGCYYVGVFALDPPDDRQRLLGVGGLTFEQEALFHQATDQTPLAAYIDADAISQLYANQVVTLDLQQHPFVTARPTFGARYRLVAPMVLHGHLIGIFTIAKTDTLYPDVQHAYPPEEIALALGIAKLTAQMIERVRLLQKWAHAHASELALQEVTRRYDTFLSLASHELRSPLTSIIGYIHLASRQMKALEQQAEHGTASPERIRYIHQHLNAATQSAHTLDRMIGDLLDVARIRAEQLVMAMRSCNLVEIVRRSVAEIQQRVPDRALRLFLPQEQHIPILADADRISQVVTNYLTNALKYSAADRPVEVRITAEGSLARVSVRDEGPGLSLEAQACLWQRFSRIPGVMVQDTQGHFGANLGIGLYLCREIIERHHGCVGVESIPGKGSIFWFTLPQTNSSKDLLSDASALLKESSSPAFEYRRAIREEQ